MKESRFWLITGLGGVFFVLILVNIYFITQNRTLQAEVNNRQQFISQSIQLEQLNKEIISALANLAVRDKDEDLKAILASNGITVSVNANAKPAEGGDKPQGKKK